MEHRCPLKDLAEAIRCGNRMAEDAFVEEAWRRVVRMAEDRLRGNRLHRYVDPEDIAQNVLIIVCKRILRNSEGAPISNWNAMLRMLTDHAIADSARSYRTELVCMRETSCCGSDSEEGIPQLADRSRASRWEEVERRGREIQCRLPPQLQTVWSMRCEGIAWHVIGGMHGCNGHAMRVRFNAWLNRLGKQIATNPGVLL